MENNNQELNNQVNTNNNQQVQPNNNKMLIILMALIIVCLAGYIVYAKFIQKGDNPEPKPTNTEENGINNQTNNNEKYENTFKYSNDGSYGIAYAKGYAEVKREYYCETVSVADCNESNADEINDVVYFHIMSTESEDLKKNLNGSYRGQSADSDSFEIGCAKNNIISFGALADDFYEKVNDNINSTENYFKNIELSMEDSNKILSSSETNPITLKFEKLKYTHGSLDFVTCMSRMTNVEVVN